MPLAELAFEERLRPVLNRQIDRNSVELLPLIYSTDGRAKLEAEIPPARRLEGAMARMLSSGNLTRIDLSLFAEFRGKTVVVIGHVAVVNGRQAFEVQRPGLPSQFIHLDAFRDAARQLGFNWFPLGCETG
ncbi:hypothetical protein, partial [Sphingomonas sp.]|uniref:hypothetical protein n=1 Tax=Sphingomonas sp. TaxID=28214 RepID=UPI0025F5674D